MGEKEDPLYFNLMGNYEARVSRESFVSKLDEFIRVIVWERNSVTNER